MAYYGIPQFAQVFPDRYLQDWRALPREIPDSFVSEFIDWSEVNGVKGKYSIVPYPACTGWLNRFIPGWTKKELESSLDLVRKDVTRNWDIHPEMISHTRVIDVRSGLPFPKSTPEFMENWEWSQNRSVDELVSYIIYALDILNDVGLRCEGVTTPGGFCQRNVPNLAAATSEAVRQVSGSAVSHFFRDVIAEGSDSVSPIVMDVRDIDGSNPSCSVHIIGCTGDWFGGWDGLTPGSPDRFISEDLETGRMIDVIDRGEPAIMVCHWPGIYFNGAAVGFQVLKTVTSRLTEKYGRKIQWMKLSEIARYWAVKETASWQPGEGGWKFESPFSTDNFTMLVPGVDGHPVLTFGNVRNELVEVSDSRSLGVNNYSRVPGGVILCFDLPRGPSTLLFER
jgi:hypothetical protein